MQKRDAAQQLTRRFAKNHQIIESMKRELGSLRRPAIAMVQVADHRDGDNLAAIRWLNLTRIGGE